MTESCKLISTVHLFGQIFVRLQSIDVLCLKAKHWNCRYKFGFCPNGSDCRYRHAKLPGPPPSVEEILQKIQHLGSYNYGSSNKFFSQRGVGLPQQNEKSQFPQGPAPVTQGGIGKPSTTESANVQQQQVQQPAQQTSQTQIRSVSNGQPNQLNRTATSLPQGISRCV